MRHAYWCAQPTRGGTCNCQNTDACGQTWEGQCVGRLNEHCCASHHGRWHRCECGCQMTPLAPLASSAGDYITTSRELTYDLAQLLADYTTDDDDSDTRPRGDT